MAYDVSGECPLADITSAQLNGVYESAQPTSKIHTASGHRAYSPDMRTHRCTDCGTPTTYDLIEPTVSGRSRHFYLCAPCTIQRYQPIPVEPAVHLAF
jgi:hypothetical protein